MTGQTGTVVVEARCKRTNALKDFIEVKPDVDHKSNELTEWLVKKFRRYYHGEKIVTTTRGPAEMDRRGQTTRYAG